MVTTWKKPKFTRFLSNLRSKGGDPLVVQAGFPTSLADLFVKNRSRLRKSSRKKQHSPPADLESSRFRAPQVVTESAAVVRLKSSGQNPGFESCKEYHLPPVVGDLVGVEIVGEIQSPSDTVETALTPPEFPKTAETETLEDSESKSRGEAPQTGRSRVLFSTVATIFLVMILAVSTKEFTVAITASAFSMLFLESVGRCVMDFLKPCTDAERSLKSVIKGVSPLIEPNESDSKRTESVSIETNVVFRFDDLGSSTSSDRSSELAVAKRHSNDSKERENPGEVNACFKKQKSGGANLKINKLMRKFEVRGH